MRPDIDSISRLTDIYFDKTKETVRRFGDKKVTYALFMRRPVISAPRLAVEWLNQVAEHRQAVFDIDLRYAEGKWVGAGEPLIYVTGQLCQLVDLETIYLQKLGPPVSPPTTHSPCAPSCRARPSWRWTRAIAPGPTWRK